MLVASLTARRLFGFSFATWRFHLRGEAIRSAHDVGWIRNLTVGRLMRRDVRTVRADTVARGLPPPVPAGLDRPRRGRSTRPSATPASCCWPRPTRPELDDKAGEPRARRPAALQGAVLLPSMNVKEAAAVFERAEADALAVVDGPEGRKVLGLLTEAHALRRYAEELDRRRRELAGEG